MTILELAYISITSQSYHVFMCAKNVNLSSGLLAALNYITHVFNYEKSSY